jgi:hypothetical protein
MPRCVLVSDVANLHLYNLETKAPPLKIKLADLPDHIENFKFIAGYETIAIDHINKEAAEKMAQLHDALKAIGHIERSGNLPDAFAVLPVCRRYGLAFALNISVITPDSRWLRLLHNFETSGLIRSPTRY